MKYRAFICCAGADRAYAARLQEDLEGFRLPLGTGITDVGDSYPWDPIIAQLLRSCGVS
jgi:hypothetical protein